MITPPDANISATLYQWATLLIPMIGFVFLGVQKWIADQRKKADVAEVKQQLIATTAIATEKMDDIHKLVNNQYGLLLTKHAQAMQTIADLRKTPEAQKAADEAAEQRNDHDQRQASIDASKT